MPKLRPIHMRTFLTATVFFVAILLIGLLWFYRDDLFQTIYDPGQPFQTYTPPQAPDYSLAESWLMRPDLSVDPIGVKEKGDVFVISPTVYLGGKHWNAPLDNSRVDRDFENIALPNYVHPYMMAGRVFAPKYRQASLYSFLTNREDAQAAQRFAYRDVKRAFEIFLQNNPPERPIVIVGHGQGGLHAQRLLTEYFSGDRKIKLAAAYILDHPLPLTAFETELKGHIPCESGSDTGCIVAFGAFTPKEQTRARMFVEKNMVWEGRFLKSVNGRPLLCINPLLWNSSTDYAPARLHLGGVAAEGLDAETLPAPSPKQTGAQCADGILMTEKPKRKSLRRPSRFGGKFRTLSSNIFYEDLRVDAHRRVENTIAKNVLPRRAPLIEMETIEVIDSPVTLPSEVKQN